MDEDQSRRATKRCDWPGSTVPAKRLLPLADQLRTSIQQLPLVETTKKRNFAGRAGMPLGWKLRPHSNPIVC